MAEYAPLTTHRSPHPIEVYGDDHVLSVTTVADTPMPSVPAEWPRVRGYEVLGVLGRGGMGVVYKARHVGLNRTVALKTLRGSALTDAEFRGRFQAEAAAAARLQHPNVVQVFEVGTTEPLSAGGSGQPYIALEFVDGGDLTRRTGSPQSPKAAAGLVEKLARAAHAAHQGGIVHRDLKPANVLLTPDGEPKIADFGVAKLLGGDDGRLTRAGNAVGTPEYMAPEQVCGGRPTPAIDTYALGVILYELLTGLVPFRGVDGPATMDLVWKQEPVSPRRLQPTLPRDLETICLKCLDKVPGRRYATAEELADDLRRWRDGRPIQARPVGTAERAARWVARNPTTTSLVLAVVAVALIGLTGVVWNSRVAEQNAAVALSHYQAERWERYRAEMVAASNAQRLFDASDGRRALDAAPAEHRNWEWRYYRGHLNGADDTQQVGDHRAVQVSITPDCRRVAYAANDAVRVWDLAGNRLAGVLTGKAVAERFVFDPTGRLIAYTPYAPNDKTVVLWDVAAGEQRAVLRGHRATMQHVAFFPDGNRVLTKSVDGEMRIWDAETAAPLPAPPAHSPEFGAVVFAPDGRRMYLPGGRTGRLQVWDVEAGRMLHALHVPGADLVTVRPSPDGRVLAVRTWGDHHHVLLWRVGEAAPYAELKAHKNNVSGFEFSPDGGRLVTASHDHTVRLWEAATGRQLAALRGHSGQVRAVAFSPDGRRLLTASQDQTVRLWDGHTGEPLAVLHGHSDEVDAADFTPDGQGVVSVARDGQVKRWSVDRAERAGKLRGHTNFVYGVAVHPDGKRVASASWDGTVRVWDADAGRELFRVEHADRKFVVSVAFNPAGDLLASYGRDGAVRLWDADTGRPLGHLPARTHYWVDGRIAFDPTGGRLAVARVGGVSVWDMASRAPVAELDMGNENGVRDVVFSPDGRRVAAAEVSDHHSVRVWDLDRREMVRTLSGHTDLPYTVAFHPAGEVLASGAIDGTVRLWDLATGRERAVLRQGCNAYALHFTPDGSRLASAGADGGIRLWDTATGKLVADLRGHDDYVHGLAFSRGGTRLVSGSGDFTLRVWDAPADPVSPAPPHPAAASAGR